MVLLLVGCVPPAAPVATSPPAPFIRGARVEWVDLQGQDRVDLLESCLRNCPKESTGATVPSRTWYRVDWSWSGDDGVPCLVAGVTSTVDIVVTLPRWAPPIDADPEAVEGWRDFVGALATHEQGHVDMVHAGDVGLRQGPPGCGDRPAYGAAVLRSLWREQLLYDEATDHGRTQGARFWGE